MSKLSIVIPALTGADLLETGLVSVLQHRPMDAEVVVVLCQPYDDPYDLKEEVRFIDAPQDAGLVECLSQGLSASSGEIVHFLASGAEVEEDWAEKALRHFEGDQVASVTPAVVCVTSPARRAIGVGYAAGGARQVIWQKRAGQVNAERVVGPEFRAAFYRRAALEHVGGLPTDVGSELADVDLALALAAAGYETVVEPACEITVPHARLRRRGAYQSGKDAERLFWRNASFGGRASALAAHVPTVLLACLTHLQPIAAFAHLAGHITGSLQGECQRRDFSHAPQPIARVSQAALPHEVAGHVS